MRAVPRFLHKSVAYVASNCSHRSVRAICSWSCLETPNPKVRKFEPVASGEGDALVALRASLPAVRSQLLLVDGVRDVFVAGTTVPWLSVTRADGVTWDPLEPQVQALLEGLPESVTSAVPLEQENTDMSASRNLGAASGLEADIEECLEGRIRPSVQADGGDVELVQWDASTGEVCLRLKGACRGCPQSAVTLKETILKTLKYFVPEVRSVVAEEDQAEEDFNDPFADIALEHDGEPAGDLIAELARNGTPFFSTFAGMKVEGKMLKRVKFMSKLELNGRTPGHVIVNCSSCKQKRAIEDPNDILRKDKGNASGNAAMVICPACCVLITP